MMGNTKNVMAIKTLQVIDDGTYHIRECLASKGALSVRFLKITKSDGTVTYKINNGETESLVLLNKLLEALLK